MRDPRTQTLVAALLMCAAVIATYYPLRNDPSDNTQTAGDFQFLHARRMAFAREHLARDGSIPGWYPHELMGQPFRANLQSFPLIPTRLVLLAVPPLSAFTVGVMLGAVLAALFTFAYVRQLGMSRLAAVGAGWTFACSGFFAARVVYGGLPLLEAYAALPLLLWLIALNLAADPRPGVGRTKAVWPLAGLALAAFWLALAGHPQLPLYAFLVAGAYLLCRGWARWRRTTTAAVAMGLGVGCAAFALYPMLMLIGRSTRTLDLAHEVNDVALPYQRLDAFIFPWKDGWPVDALRRPGQAFEGYPDAAYFYETVNFVGWLPLIAAAALLIVAAVRWRKGLNERRGRVGIFLAAAGLLALLTALPLFHGKAGDLGLTLVRSPARQTYVTTFVLAVALGGAVDLLRHRLAPRAGARVALAAAATLLAAHAVQLAWHDRAFILTSYLPVETPQSKHLEDRLRHAVGDGRIGIDYKLAAPFVRRIDDVGFFDSLLLARPYATLLAYANAPRDLNRQHIDASQLPVRALEAAGVKLVMTARHRPDLQPAGMAGDVPLYNVPNPVARATFVPGGSVHFVDPAQMRSRMRDKSFDPHTQVMLPPPGAGAPATAAAAPSTGPAADAATYERPGPDEIVVRARTSEAGVIRVLESFDPGWRAQVNGRPADVLAADDTFLGVSLPAAGEHRVRFTYHTPGTTTGAVISLASVVMLCALLAWTWKSATAPPSTLPA